MRRGGPLLLAVLLLAAPAACGDPDRVETSPAAPSPGAPASTVVPPGQGAPELRPNRVPVVPGAVDLRPHPFDSAEVIDERRLAVRFWGGVAPCSVVGRVRVNETPERVTVTVFTGRDPTPGRVACIEIAQYQEVVVGVAAPVGDRAIVDGAR